MQALLLNIWNTLELSGLVYPVGLIKVLQCLGDRWSVVVSYREEGGGGSTQADTMTRGSSN